MSYIYRAFGFMLNLIYGVVENYGIAIILFTLFIKIVLLPLTLKQQKSMTKMQRIQPKLTELQEKYKYDKDKAAQETMKLYKEYGVNPMGGCLPLIIQFPILIAFYQVIQKPVQYVLGYSATKLAAALEANGLTATTAGVQILLAEKLGELNFNFFGLDLATTPWQEIKLFMAGKAGAIALTALIIPVLSCVTTFLTSKISTLMNKKKGEDKKEEKKPQRVLSPGQKTQDSGNSAESMAKSMTYFMPIMTLWLTLTFPSALGLYWTVSNVLSLVQTILLNGYYNKKLEKEIEAQDAEREKKVQEKMKKYNMKKKKRG